jgi:hypothetical protein
LRLVERETRLELATPSLAIIRIENRLLLNLKTALFASKLLKIRGSRKPPVRESARMPYNRQITTRL